jgi:hypothetical protein
LSAVINYTFQQRMQHLRLSRDLNENHTQLLTCQFG